MVTRLLVTARFILFLALLFASACSVAQPATNQRLFDTVGFLPEYYPQRVAQFEQEPVQKRRIIFLGNSITQMGNWKELLHDTTVVNRGIAGDITFGVLKRLDDVVIRQPSRLFLLIGINDIGKDIPDAVIAANIRKIIRRIAAGSPDTKIYVQSILPVNPTVANFPQHYDKNDHVITTNALIARVALEENVSYIDLHALFRDREGLLDARYTGDGLHLTPPGYEKWVVFLHEKAYLLP